MKMEEQNFFETEVKLLHKKFHILDKPHTKILYEFCEFDVQKAYKILALAKTIRNPVAIIQNLIKNPQKSEEYIEQLVKRYDNEIGEKVDFFIQKIESKLEKKQFTKLNFYFFEEIPEDTISSIMCFLDPYSFKSFTFTNAAIFKIGKAQSMAELYKQICKTLFSMTEPVLPEKCRFESIKRYVQAHPQQYFPYFNNFKNAVNNNLRNYIWRIQSKDLKLDKNYYFGFGSYQNLFEKCPRVNMNGYYMCKYKYVKIGEKNMIHAITPIHVIYYYRYLRFLEDGSVVYYVCNRKLKSQDIIKALTKNHLFLQNKDSILGEFMQHKNKLYLKAGRDSSVFCYQMEINSTERKICNQLRVLRYKLELIDKSDMNQTLYQAHPHKDDVIFNYFFHEDIRQQNSPRIQACSL